MPTAWRLTKTKHVGTAFDGMGASAAGGRWNSCGTAVVYCSATLSLAALEVLVHLNARTRLSFSALAVDFEDSAIEVLDLAGLPSTWRDNPAGLETRRRGDQWVAEYRSLILAVPSAIVPTELNYLINPAHPDFKQLKVGAPQSFAFDPRLLRGTRR